MEGKTVLELTEKKDGISIKQACKKRILNILYDLKISLTQLTLIIVDESGLTHKKVTEIICDMNSLGQITIQAGIVSKK